MHPDTLTRLEYKGNIYVKIRKKIHVVYQTGSGFEKKSQHS